MNSGFADIAVDGMAIRTSVNSQLTSADSTVDIIELRRRIERKDAEIKRKDRDVAALQKEVAKLDKDNRALKEENDNISRSLSNARMLNASVTDETEQYKLKHRISELESQLAESEASVNLIKGELEALRANQDNLESGIVQAFSNQDHTTQVHKTTMQEINELNVRIKILNMQLEERDKSIASLNEQLAKSDDACRRFKGETSIKHLYSFGCNLF